MKKYKCTICKYEYDPAQGDPTQGIAPGTPFEALPADWKCPRCKQGKEKFEPVAEVKANPYAGTQTEKNLHAAFAGESEARNKYTYFASKAKKEGYEQIAALFLQTAENEKEHAKLWFKELNGIGDTAEEEAGQNGFHLDSKEPDWSKFRDFIMGEVRYNSLMKTFPQEAEELFVATERNAKLRYEGYKKLSEM